ncbi:MAG: hypothetical protein U1F40_07990 [Turneriella sp.]
MQAFEFQTEIQNHAIRIPPELEAKLPSEGQLRVIILAGEDDDASWQRATASAFLSGYADSDSIYDKI